MNIGFSSSNNFLGRVIRWATGIEANYAYFKFSLAEQEVVVYADYKSVRIDTFNNFSKDKDIVTEFVLKISKKEEDALIDYAFECAEEPGDWLDVLGYIWVLISGALGTKIRNPINGRPAFKFCRFILMAIRRKTGLGWTKHLRRDVVSPSDLIEFLSLHPHARKIC